MKQSKLFLIIFFISLISISIIYLVIYDRLIKNIPINHSYKDFLLRHTQGSRLIIDGGSNSVFGINSPLLEKQLGILTINIADNGAYPLREKLYRLESYVQPNDIILLPLEWLHYFSTTKTPTIFLESLFDELSFYYHAMPFFIKLDLIKQTPFSSVLKTVIKRIKSPSFKMNAYSVFLNYKNSFAKGERGDYKTVNTPENSPETLTCNDYLFSQNVSTGVTYTDKGFILSEEFKKNGLVISDSFKENIKLIHNLQKKGIHIILTPPVVVGKNCYQGEYTAIFKSFISNIENYLAQNNILFIGSSEESLFSPRYKFNSYYHVIASARDIRTIQLIKNIRNSAAIHWIKQQPIKPLKIDQIDFFNSLQTVSENQKITLNSLNLPTLLLTKGWYPIEDWGVWSNGNESVLYIKLSQELVEHHLKLTLENDLYKTQDKTTVFINDKKLGDYFLNGKKSLIIPKSFLNKEGLLKLQFNHYHVKSPLEYGDNQDARKIKFGLKSMQFSIAPKI